MGDVENTPCVYMMVGLPRSGKSTYVNNIFKGHFPIISADQLRYHVYGQQFWGPGEDMMWAIRKTMLRALLEQGINVVIDETNTTKARRKAIIDLAAEYGYSVSCIVIVAPANVCIKRAMESGDNKLVPVIDRMVAQYEGPDPSEGIVSVVYV